MTAKNTGDDDENRGRQILAAAGILFTVMFLVVSLLVGWRYIPGWVGESFGTVAGVLTTPFFMEASFALLGIFIVVGLNTWRRHKAGDEYVTMEITDIPESQVGEGDRKANP